MTRRRSVGLFLAIMVAVLAVPSSALASVDVFLKIAGIVGESADATHRNEIDVLSWSWGTSTGTAKTKKGTLPSACIQDMNFLERISAASPQIILNSVSGQIASDATLTVRRAGDRQQEFLIIKMTNVTIVSYQISDSTEDPTESVVLHFDTLHGEYHRQDDKGNLLPAIIFDVSGACN